MNVASRPRCRAISWTADLSRNDRSAASTQLGVAEVDLELAGRELVVGRGHPQPGVPQLPQHVQRAGPAGRPCGRPRRRCPARWRTAASRRRRRRLADEELQLGAADQACSRGSASRLGDPPGHGRAATPARARRPGCAASPRHQAAFGSHGSGVSVARSGRTVMSGRPGLQAALHRHHVAHRRGVVDRAAERQPVARPPWAARRAARPGRGPRRSCRGRTPGRRPRPAARSRSVTVGGSAPQCAGWPRRRLVRASRRLPA